METPLPESKPKQDTAKKQQNKDKIFVLLFTKRNQQRKLEAEIDEILQDWILYGDKE